MSYYSSPTGGYNGSNGSNGFGRLNSPNAFYRLNGSTKIPIASNLSNLSNTERSGTLEAEWRQRLETILSQLEDVRGAISKRQASGEGLSSLTKLKQQVNTHIRDLSGIRDSRPIALQKQQIKQKIKQLQARLPSLRYETKTEKQKRQQANKKTEQRYNKLYDVIQHDPDVSPKMNWLLDLFGRGPKKNVKNMLSDCDDFDCLNKLRGQVTKMSRHINGDLKKKMNQKNKSYKSQLEDALWRYVWEGELPPLSSNQGMQQILSPLRPPISDPDL